MCSDELVDQASSLVHFSQTLPYFRVRADDVNGCSNLHLLEGINVGELRIHSLENVRSLEEANKVKLLEKQNLSELRLAWTVGAVRLLEDKDLLGQLVPPRGLKHMCLGGYSSAGFPGWLMGTSSCHLTNLVSIKLHNLPTCRDLPPLGQLPHLEKLFLYELPGIKRINREFCGGKRAFRRLSSFQVSLMEGWEEWDTTYSVEDGVEEFMFPVLDRLEIRWCPRLRLKPCPPTFLECSIYGSDQVISCLEEVDKTSRLCSSSSRAIKLDLRIEGDSCQSIRLFHHLPALRELRISGDHLMSVPESMRHLTSLECLTLHRCDRISALPEWHQCDHILALPEWHQCDHISAVPEWLGNLSSLKSLVISGCRSINSLPSCIQQLTKLQKLEIRYNPKLKKWWESEENKTKLAHINVIQVSSLPSAEMH
jgi:Leucine-rich repeat (LRR) protein